MDDRVPVDEWTDNEWLAVLRTVPPDADVSVGEMAVAERRGRLDGSEVMGGSPTDSHTGQPRVVVPGTPQYSRVAIRAHQAGVPVSLNHDTGEWTIPLRAIRERRGSVDDVMSVDDDAPLDTTGPNAGADDHAEDDT